MDDLEVVVSTGIFFAGIPGVLVALLMLCIPVVRRRLGENGSARVRIAFGTALLALVVVYVGLAYLGASFGYDFHLVLEYPPDPSRLEDNKSALIRELWLINMTPGSLYQPCYTRDPVLCAILKDEFRYYISTDDSYWIFHVSLSFLAGLVAGALFYVGARKFTSQAKHPDAINL